MPFEQFDRSRLRMLPLSQRVHDLDLSAILDPDTHKIGFRHPTIDLLSDRIIAAREKGAAVLMMMGAHVIRAGTAPYLLRLMEKGLITHFALNGAGSIHDFEFAEIGATTESVARYISEGQFGLWTEDAHHNEAVNQGAAEGLGFGEAIGKYIEENKFPYRQHSLCAGGYRMQVPVTVHVGVGCDIVHEHPNCDGAAIGKASYTDFLIYAKTVENLENGVFLNFGSAVIGPEVYLKALAMARNVARQEGRSINHFTTAVFDLHALEGLDINEAPPKTDARYYFRPWKTIMARTVADGGEGYYVQGNHGDTVPALAAKLLAAGKNFK
ncbi:hypothetical protein [Leadbettera azotonutricia]|uniref:Deoxyhypusine synthase n=1 Tax=Leadbettera azotonutricia (strain ATCC BAA-888 / DSM 13862 / ZAS-9) TaxID=545695 RepID=F5Y867_LEAAZ|nr:hypothetical protein [Leadbettera azotonutricia]AEF80455.1 conserved hypothetical protein [Leadbettera azotonutricia ZAS-9]